MIRDGLRTLQARDAAVESWLRGEVAKSYDNFMSNPELGISVSDIMERVQTAYRERVTKAKD